jgi:hypothetical protein
MGTKCIYLTKENEAKLAHICKASGINPSAWINRTLNRVCAECGSPAILDLQGVCRYCAKTNPLAGTTETEKEKHE